jgi:TRAP-type C4-dicarboxylate transport system permease small subunit
MTDMDAFESVARRVSKWFNGIALASLSVMLGLVTADILGAKALGMPVPGAMDLTSLLGLLIIGFSTSETQIMGRHIKVDFVTMRTPERLRKIFRCISITLCILFFTAAVWRVFNYAHGFQVSGEASLTVKIPLAPFAYALAAAFALMVLVLFIELYHIVRDETNE